MQKLDALIADVARSGATVTPTLHIFAQRVGVAPYTSKSLGTFDRSEAWTQVQRQRARRGYEILAGYVRRMHEAGIPLAVGTDWLEPGRVALSEMILLHQAGIPMADVLSIATLGGARVMERDADYGSIEPGRMAQLVIFDRNPLDDPEAVLAGKTVIKDGVIVRPR
jgi:imidazolonepropionase-like amidohydrolase